MAGCVDAVLVNRTTMGNQTWNVGVTLASTQVSGANVHYEESETLPFGVPYEFFSLNELRLFEFYVPVTDTGWIVFDLEMSVPRDNTYLFYFADDFTVGGLEDYDAVTWTIDGHGRGYIEITEAGYHCLAIVDDPIDGSERYDAVLTVGPAEPDLLAVTPPGWHSSLVPHPADDGTTGSAALPDTLHGGPELTWLNMGFFNNSPISYTGVEPISIMVERDDYGYMPFEFASVGSNSFARYNDDLARDIPGGRHTLAMIIDEEDAVDEVDETNNVYGEQFCWSPFVVPMNTVQLRSLGNERTAGFDNITSGEAVWYNCDGLRLLGDYGFWSAIAACPSDPNDDGDLRLHEKLVGVKNGFAGSLVTSDYGGPGETEFVLVNFNRTAYRAFDVGLVNLATRGYYRAEAVVCQYLDDDPDDNYGPYTIDWAKMLKLHEMYLSAGKYSFHLENDNPDCNLGMTLHSADEAYQWKGLCVDDALSDNNGLGEDENFTVTITSADYYCLSVWKSTNDDLWEVAEYSLEIGPDLTPVPEENVQPVATCLTGAYPNPFNPTTTIHFDLAEAGDVRLEIFNAKGGLVCRLLDGPMEAGRHGVPWNGLDRRGQRAASGVYLVRLETGLEVGMTKVVLLK